MIKRLFLLMVAGVLTLAASDASGQEIDNKGKIGQYRAKLASARTPMDSVLIYYNIFDLSLRKDKREVVREMYPVARRTGNNDLLLDLCRQLAMVIDRPKELSEVEKEVRRIPASDAQRETELVLQMRKISINSREMKENQRQLEIAKTISHFENIDHENKYHRFLDLFTVVEYLRNESQGELLSHYVDELVNLTYTSDFKLDAIPNFVLADIANIYSDAENHDKAVEADTRVLKVISDLEKKYADMGRTNRNYDIEKYVIYRRMLRNYPALTREQVEDAYNKCVQFAAVNPDIKEDINENPTVLANYYMATGDYAKAIPLLKTGVEESISLVFKRQFLKRLIEATEKTGDDHTRIYALSEYNKILTEFNQKKADEKYRELQIRYDVKNLNEKNALLEKENRETELDSARNLMTFVCVAFLLIFIGLVVMLLNWGKYKKNSTMLRRIVFNLNSERNLIRRDVYYDHETMLDPLATSNLDDQWEEELKSHKGKGQTGALKFLVESMVNDLLHISLVGKTQRSKYIESVSVDTAMRESFDKTEGLDKKHKVQIVLPEDNPELHTDRECLTDMFAHVFTTTVHHCADTSWIRLTFDGIKDNKAYFSFIMNEKIYGLHDHPRLFDMLVNFDDLLYKRRNGMYICRMITMLMYSNLRQDYHYTEGHRYIFTTPVDLMRPEW